MAMSLGVETQFCDELTVSGEPCRGRSLPGETKCWAHSPTLEDKRQAAYQRGGEVTGARVKFRWASMASGGLESPQAIREHLEAVLQTCYANHPSPGILNVAVATLRAAASLYESTTLEDKIAEVEGLVAQLEHRE